MTSHFTSEFFAGNRTKLRTLFSGDAPIVITANGTLQRSADTTYPFRQDSNFWYLTGINEPDVILVIDKDKEYLIVPARSASREAFDGQINHTELSAISGIQEIYDDKVGWQKLTKRIKRLQHVATLVAPSSYIVSQGMYTNPARGRLVERLRAVNAGLELLDVRQQLTRLRMVKQQPEIVAIQAAVDVTLKTLTKAKKKLASFSHEYKAEAFITYEFNRRGARHAYSPIVASGHNACTLHYVANNGPVISNNLLLLDVGAEIENYAADITRTYATGEPTKRQLLVWEAVTEVQEYAISIAKPGVTITTYEKQVEAYMGEKLRELGLIKTINHESVRKYYPHATSHFLGLDVHDAADYERPLDTGMVITVEPGIYIPEESIGIRIEDNVLLSKRSPLVLSKNLPRTL